MSEETAMVSIFGVIFVLIIIVIVFCLYFIPTFVAFSRKHQFKWIIFLINLFTGFTFFGWVGALVWALIDTDQNPQVYIQPPTNPSQFSVADELEKLTKLRDNGDISNLEFSELKEKLLEGYNKLKNR
jgi:hypothetical protein